MEERGGKKAERQDSGDGDASESRGAGSKRGSGGRRAPRPERVIKTPI